MLTIINNAGLPQFVKKQTENPTQYREVRLQDKKK